MGWWCKGGPGHMLLLSREPMREQLDCHQPIRGQITGGGWGHVLLPVTPSQRPGLLSGLVSKLRVMSLMFSQSEDSLTRSGRSEASPGFSDFLSTSEDQQTKKVSLTVFCINTSLTHNQELRTQGYYLRIYLSMDDSLPQLRSAKSQQRLVDNDFCCIIIHDIPCFEQF